MRKINFSALDPLGEKQRLAKLLWEEAGSPEDKTWEDFWELADEQLTRGVSSGQISGRARKKTAEQEQLPNGDVLPLIEQEEDTLLSIVAAAIGHKLNEHEALCLGKLLRDHRVFLKDGRELLGGDEGRAAKIVAALAAEPPREAVEAQNLSSVRKLTEEQKLKCWIEYLKHDSVRDEALSFATRNTIQRLASSIAREQRVKAITYLNARLR